jgi:hypothetical protein
MQPEEGSAGVPRDAWPDRAPYPFTAPVMALT